MIEGKYDRLILTEDWTYIRLIPGPYENKEYKDPTSPPVVTRPGYFKFRRHYLPRAKPPFETCRRASEYMDLSMCPACQADDREPSWAYAFTVLGLAYYHKVPTPSQKNPNRTFDRMHKCERTKQNRNCRWCAGGYKYQLGYRMHATFNSIDFEFLYNKVHLKMRDRCACGGDITVVQGACPRCHNILLDVNKSGLSDSEFHRQLNNKIACPICDVLVKLQQIRRCSKCAQPKPLSMFDCNIRARLVAIPGKDYKNTEFEIVGVGPLAKDYGEVRPLDLPVIYAPSPLGVLKRKIPGLRAKMAENPADPNAVPKDLRPPIGAIDEEEDDGPKGPPPPPFEDMITVSSEPEESSTPAPASMDEALRAAAPSTKRASSKKPTGRPAAELPPSLDGDLGEFTDGDDDEGEPWNP